MSSRRVIARLALELGFKLVVSSLPRDKRAEYFFSHPSMPERQWAFLEAGRAYAFLQGWESGFLHGQAMSLRLGIVQPANRLQS